MPTITKVETRRWSVPFFSATNRKYKLTYSQINWATRHHSGWTNPVSLVEMPNETIVATFPDMSKTVYGSLGEMAADFASTIVECESEEVVVS